MPQRDPAAAAEEAGPAGAVSGGPGRRGGDVPRPLPPPVLLLPLRGAGAAARRGQGKHHLGLRRASGEVFGVVGLFLPLRRAAHRPRTCRVPRRVGAMPRRGAAAPARGARARRERDPGAGLALPREARGAGAGPRPEGTRAPRGGSAVPALPQALPPSYFLSAAPEFLAAAPAPVPSRCSGAGPPAGTAAARARLRGRAGEPGGLRAAAAEGLCPRPAVPSGLGFSWGEKSCPDCSTRLLREGVWVAADAGVPTFRDLRPPRGPCATHGSVYQLRKTPRSVRCGTAVSRLSPRAGVSPGAVRYSAFSHYLAASLPNFKLRSCEGKHLLCSLIS